MNSAQPIRLSEDISIRVMDYLSFHLRYLPVRDPSSITRQVILPSLMISPSLAGTKLTGRVGTCARDDILMD